MPPFKAALEAQTLKASRVSESPLAVVCAIEHGEMILKNAVGLVADQAEPFVQFCERSQYTGSQMVVGDARTDPRVADLSIAVNGAQVVFCAALPIHSPFGNVIGAVCVADTIAHDWTEAQELRITGVAGSIAALLESQLPSISGLTGSSPVGVMTTDAKGTIVFTNAELEHVFGYEPGELLGQHIKVLIPHELHEAHDRHVSAFIATPESRCVGRGRLLAGVRKDGSPVHAEVGLSPIHTEAGLFVHALVVDVTERFRSEIEQRRLNAELQQKTLALEQFVYSASHDLKTPIVTIEGFAGYLLQDLREGRLDRLEDFTLRITNAAARIRRNVDDLLEISRAGYKDVPEGEADPSAIAVSIAEHLRFQSEQAHAIFDVQPDIPAVRCNETRLRRVMQNLLDNALMHAKPEGEALRILVSGSRSGGHVDLCVADNGQGVAPEYRERVFGLFERLDSTGDGSGMGLALVKRVAEIYRGRAWVESSPTGGAAFHITLPSAEGRNGEP
ncbi:MAG: PAS domain S-box protein [Phycisphaeraceae bacterium]|nr:MAG: PAS domain S-box protein [Phycisphaeraceae bacterium]